MTGATEAGSLVPSDEPLVAAEPVAAGARRRSLPAALLVEARPKQWAKNVLVFAAPGAAGVLEEGPVLARTLGSFVAFCLVASGIYFLNDVGDVEADRRHPRKRARPVAAGEISVALALTVGVTLVVAGLGLALAVGWEFAVVLVVYLAITVSYTLGLKHVAVVDIAAVASGFIVRAVAGGVAAGVPISQWFLIVASFGSLFMVAGKRHGEHLEMGDDRGGTRITLAAYSAAYLRYVWMISSGVAITAYCLWAFEQSQGRSGVPWYELSIIPFVLALLRYALLLEAGHGSAPEDVVLGDRTLQVLGATWVVVFGLGVYLGR